MAVDSVGVGALTDISKVDIKSNNSNKIFRQFLQAEDFILNVIQVSHGCLVPANIHAFYKLVNE
jgi:hypothetical protein